MKIITENMREYFQILEEEKDKIQKIFHHIMSDWGKTIDKKPSVRRCYCANCERFVEAKYNGMAGLTEFSGNIFYICPNVERNNIKDLIKEDLGIKERRTSVANRG